MTYGQYLKVDELIQLQKTKSEGKEHDEMLFIVIHQVYELWFKQVLHEIYLLQNLFNQGETHRSLATLKRILTIFKTLVAQVDILETMTPLSFASFRNLLSTSSGFQSAQFRKIEFLLGAKKESMIQHFQNEPQHVQDLKAIFESPTIYDSFFKLVKKEGYNVPENILKRDFKQVHHDSEDLQKIFIDIYRTNPLLSQLCERLVDLDEGLQEWRYRHVKMVERTIGVKMGTGGSPGAEYLKKTLFQPLFPELWSIRSQF